LDLAKTACRQNKRKSGNRAVVSRSSFALRCAGLSHLQFVAGGGGPGSNQLAPPLPRRSGWHA